MRLGNVVIYLTMLPLLNLSKLLVANLSLEELLITKVSKVCNVILPTTTFNFKVHITQLTLNRLLLLVVSKKTSL